VQNQIIAGAKTAFLQGDQWASTAGIVAILVGASVVFFFFPKKQEEDELLARYHAEDTPQPMQPTEPERTTLGLSAPSGAGVAEEPSRTAAGARK
jgi:hypothetical protein